MGDKALEIGTENQTKLCGGPVKGALFDFHPQIDEYLNMHLFGDIFARDVLDWRTREIVTIAALEAWMRVLAELDILNAYERIRSCYINMAETLAGRK